MKAKVLNSLIILTVFLFSVQTFAAAIDFHGFFGLQSTAISNVRKASNSLIGTIGETQEISDGDDNGSFHNYIFVLNPQIIINDGVSIFSELTAGNNEAGMRGGFLGDSSDQYKNNAYETHSSRSALQVNQLYTDIYADTATFRIGRFSRHFGLGAMINDGTQNWDRFASIYDGLEARFKIGNFHFIPGWARLNVGSKTNLGKSNVGKTSDVREVSLQAVYDNPHKNLAIGVYYGKRNEEEDNSLSQRGRAKFDLVDIYIKKSWKDWSFSLEVPMLSGELGDVYGSSINSSAKSKALITEITYSTAAWDLGLNAGMVSGDDGDTDDFEGIYLHPNFHVGEILFRYNNEAFTGTDQALFESSISNARYARFFAHYRSGAWKWKMNVILATADQVAKAGKQAYNHEIKNRFNATQDQDDSYGMELNASFDYEWNPGLTVSSYMAYMKTGNYYAFTNNATEADTENPIATGFRVGVKF